MLWFISILQANHHPMTKASCIQATFNLLIFALRNDQHPPMGHTLVMSALTISDVENGVAR